MISTGDDKKDLISPLGEKRERNLYKHIIKITSHNSLCTLCWLWNISCYYGAKIYY